MVRASSVVAQAKAAGPCCEWLSHVSEHDRLITSRSGTADVLCDTVQEAQSEREQGH